MISGYLAMSALFVFGLLAVPDFRQAGVRKAQAEAREIADDAAHWALAKASDGDSLYAQRATLLGDDRAAYTDRYLDRPVRYDWAGFVEDELARLDAEIAALGRAA